MSVVCVAMLTAQTKIVAPDNRYSVADDVKLGREAAAEVTKELPLLNDSRVDQYVAEIGTRLASAIPPEFRHPEFMYTFRVVNQKEINAFALPGGPMFLNRGMIEAAKTEGEMAGVMAHEMSHVALRHGTAQATKGQKFQIGSILGQIAGAVVGGTAGSVISQGTQFGLGTYFLKYSREYESQADILGAQMLARAGYQPREMANMFKTIEAEGGGQGPQWMSSHPNPKNRYEAINREAASLRVQGNGDSGQFASIQGRLKGMGPSYTAEEIAKGKAKSGEPTRTANRTTGRVDPPSTEYRSSRPLEFLRLSVPSNWEEVSGDQRGVTYAPQGGYDGEAFTHGVQIGIGDKGTGDLRRDTDTLISSLTKANRQLRTSGGYSRESIAGRAALRTTLANVSEATGQNETVSLTTTRLTDGRLLFLIGVAPQTEASMYQDTFRRVRQSVQLND
ncbi:MAG TPA: M48 family metalloprotease [Vicinamibacterales bacterium]|jgi:peptidase M48-like protein|nr:M48 family metalloprotease [Vicinamibacterales bacterium]